MPRFRAIDRQVSAPGPTRSPQASAQDFGGDKGLMAFGQGVENAANTFRQHIIKQEVFDADNLVAQESVDVTEFTTGLQNEASLDQARGFAERSVASLDERKNQILENFKGGAVARQRLEEGLRRVYTNQAGQMQKYEVQLHGQKRVQDLASTLEKFNNMNTTQPHTVKTNLQEFSDLVHNTPDLDPGVKSKVIEQAKSTMFGASLDGFVSNILRDPDSTSEDIGRAIAELRRDGNLYKNNADNRDYARGLSRLEQGFQTKKKSDMWEYEQGFKEWSLKAVSIGEDDGTFTEASIRQTMSEDPKKAEGMVRKLELVRAEALAAHDIKGVPFQKVVTDLDPKKLEDRIRSLPADRTAIEITKYQTKRKAFENAVKAFNKDPAGYMISQNETVSLAHEGFNEALENDDGSEEAIEARVRALDHYVATLGSEMKSLSPGTPPSILTAQQASAVGAQLQRLSSDPQAAGQALDILNAQKSIYGKHWPSAIRDLMKYNAISRPQAVASTLLDDPAARPLARAMLVAAATPEAQLKKALPEAEYTHIQREVRERLAPFSESIGDSLERTETIGAYIDAITRTAAHMQIGGDKVRGRDLVDAIVTNKYHFSDNIRIPRDAGVSRSEVKNAQYRILSKGFLAEQQLVSPMGDLLADDISRRHINSIASFGSLATRADDSGVELVDANGEIVMVRGSDGVDKPLSYDWKDLELLSNEGRKIRRRAGTQTPHLGNIGFQSGEVE